jgi:predicted ArsR family transcriptional regulator
LRVAFADRGQPLATFNHLFTGASAESDVGPPLTELMATHNLRRDLIEQGSRGRIVEVLRRGGLTVQEIAT